MESFLKDLKHIPPHVLAEPRVYSRCRRRPGARHRIEYGHILGGEYSPPEAGSDRLTDILVLFMTTSRDGQSQGASPAKFQHWREQKSVVEKVGGISHGSRELDGRRLS